MNFGLQRKTTGQVQAVQGRSAYSSLWKSFGQSSHCIRSNGNEKHGMNCFWLVLGCFVKKNNRVATVSFTISIFFICSCDPLLCY